MWLLQGQCTHVFHGPHPLVTSTKRPCTNATNGCLPQSTVERPQSGIVLYTSPNTSPVPSSSQVETYIHLRQNQLAPPLIFFYNQSCLRPTFALLILAATQLLPGSSTSRDTRPHIHQMGISAPGPAATLRQRGNLTMRSILLSIRASNATSVLTMVATTRPTTPLASRATARNNMGMLLYRAVVVFPPQKGQVGLNRHPSHRHSSSPRQSFFPLLHSPNTSSNFKPRNCNPCSCNPCYRKQCNCNLCYRNPCNCSPCHRSPFNCSSCNRNPFNRNPCHPSPCNLIPLNINSNTLNTNPLHLSTTHYWESYTAQQIPRMTIPCILHPRGPPTGGLRDACVLN